jgi:CheY-like chemotaxis protein
MEGKNQKEKPRILIAEDHPLNQKLVSFMLKNKGYESAVCNSGTEALRMLEKESFNLVLMDIEMPEMDGITATRCIREKLGSDIPVIALTAHGSEEEKEKCRRAGMNNYLTKPFKADEFYAMIESYLQEPVLEDLHKN